MGSGITRQLGVVSSMRVMKLFVLAAVVATVVLPRQVSPGPDTGTTSAPPSDTAEAPVVPA